MHDSTWVWLFSRFIHFYDPGFPLPCCKDANLKQEVAMKNKFTFNMEKLNEVLERPIYTERFQEVFSFVEAVTGRKYNPDNLTPEDIAVWNKRFDEVLQQLFAHTT
jgi:hypothetical protein